MLSVDMTSPLDASTPVGTCFGKHATMLHGMKAAGAAVAADEDVRHHVCQELRMEVP